MRAAVLPALLLALAGCHHAGAGPMNPVGYFEVPVSDMDRAVAFYTRVLGTDFERATIEGYPMALFPSANGAPGASGALVKGDVYVPAKAGPILYFSVDDLDAALARATAAGAAILYPPKDLGELGRVAEIEDSEGNRIALHQAAE